MMVIMDFNRKVRGKSTTPKTPPPPKTFFFFNFDFARGRRDLICKSSARGGGILIYKML